MGAARLEGARIGQSAQRSATKTIRFDTVPTNANGTLRIPNGYAQLQWEGFAAVKVSDVEAQIGSDTGYTTGNISGERVAFFGGSATARATISSGSDANFALKSVYLTSAFRDGESVTIRGYDDGVERYVRTVTISDDAPLLVNLGMNAVDSVTFFASGGTPTSEGAHVVLDDLRATTGPGSIHGFVFNDRNGNGRQNANDTALDGRLVFIDENANGAFDRGERSTRSAADGSYSFSDVAMGEYDVSFVAGSGRTATTQELGHYSYNFAPISDTWYTGTSQVVTPLSNGVTDMDEGTYIWYLNTPIRLWGETFSALYISVNGLIEFGRTSSSTFLNTTLPNAARGPLIAPFWSDLELTGGGSLSVAQDAGTHQTVITWRNAKFFEGSDSSTNTFQIVINDDGRIFFNYQDMSAVPSGDSNGITIGLQGFAKDTARTYTVGTNVPDDGASLVFFPAVDFNTYGTAHVVVDSGRDVRVDFGAMRATSEMFASGNEDATSGWAWQAIAHMPLFAEQHVMLV